jgi:hypothetical protein
MRFRKVERRILKPSKRKVAEVRMLEKRAVGSHHRWRALAEEPERTPLAAVLLLAAKMKGRDD